MDNWDDIYKSLGYLPNSIQHLGVILQLDGGLVVKVCWLGGCGVTRDGGGCAATNAEHSPKDAFAARWPLVNTSFFAPCLKAMTRSSLWVSIARPVTTAWRRARFALFNDPSTAMTSRACVSGSLPLPALTQQSVVLVGNDPYYVRPRVAVIETSPLAASSHQSHAFTQAILPLSVPTPVASGLVPATVINLRGEPISLSVIQRSISSFLNEDDVFQNGFVKGGYLVVSQGDKFLNNNNTP